jgi:2-oxoglutarate ferredoxin oxidoreductase subunit gamma
MNQPSVNKFGTWLEKDGVLIYNQSLVNNLPKRQDIKFFPIDANNLAIELSNIMLANMIMLGALISITGVYDFDYLLKSIEKFFSQKGKSKIVSLNKQAAEIGYKIFAKKL